MALSGRSTRLIAALRSILQELEADPEAQADQPEIRTLKLQIVAALTEVELHQQATAAPSSAPKAIAILAERLRESAPALAAQPDALPPLTKENAA